MTSQRSRDTQWTALDQQSATNILSTLSTLSTHNLSIYRMLSLLVLSGALHTIGCSDMADDANAYADAPVYAGDFAGESDAETAIPTVEPDQDGGIRDNFAGDSAGEGAGEVAGEEAGEGAGYPPSDSSCEALATPGEELISDYGLAEICLESLIPYTSSNEQGEQGESRDTSSPICDLADKLSETLSAQGVEVTCVDEDGDCYYVCAGWELPDTLQDLDDSRDFITNGVDDVVNAMSPEPEGVSCLNLDSSSEPICCNLNSGDDESIVCRVPITSAEGATIQRVQICQGGAMLWVSELDGALSLHAAHLDTLERVIGVATRLIDELDVALVDVDELAELQCSASINQAGSRSISAMFTDAQGQLYHLDQSLSGQYRVTELYSGDDRVMITGGDAEGTALQLTLDEAVWGVENLKVNDQGFFSWELSVTPLDGAAQELRYASYEYNPTPIFIPETVIDHAITPDARGIKVASLNDLGALSFAQVNQDMTDPIRYEASSFNRLISGANVLAQASSEPSASARFLVWGSDNFWGDPDSTLRIPLVVSAAQLGFETLEVGSISGMMALLKLNDVNAAEESPAMSSTWGLYDIMSGRLHLFDWAAQLSGIFNDIDFTLKAPRLINNRVFWVEDAPLQGDESVRQPVVISARINR